MRPARWAGTAVVSAGLATLSVVLTSPAGDVNSFERGLLYTILRYDQALPLAGLGLLLAHTPLLRVAANLALFAVAIPAGSVIGTWLAQAVPSAAFVLASVLAIGPACMLAVGLALALPTAANLILPAAALLCGVALGLAGDASNLTLEAWQHPLGAILAGSWLVVASLLLRRRFTRPWVTIAVRIYGGWLIAIGVMLCAAVATRM